MEIIKYGAFTLNGKEYMVSEVRLWFPLITMQVQGMTTLEINSGGAKTNMGFHGNLIFQNKFEL